MCYCLLCTDFYLDTTDVQEVRVAEVRGKQDSALIHCDFILGTDALGCMVILVGEVTNTTVIVNRDDTTGVGVASTELPLPLDCYHDVMAFDIEADGSNGTLAITGTLERETDSRVKCVPTKDIPLKGENQHMLIGYTLSPYVHTLTLLTQITRQLLLRESSSQ